MHVLLWFVFFFEGKCNLEELVNKQAEVNVTQCQTITEDDSDNSGIEIVSTPQKEKIAEKDHPFVIEGVGLLSTAWIGQTGRKEFMYGLKHQVERHEVLTLQRDLHKLSRTCLDAFNSLNSQDSNTAQVQKAKSLCESYSVSKKKPLSFNTKVQQLWKTAELMTPVICDTTEQACAVLGESLVEVITEKNKQPPDVSARIQEKNHNSM